MCCELVKTDPSHLDSAPPNSLVVRTQKQLPYEFKNNIQATTRVIDGLVTLKLKPYGMKGSNLFDHMIKKRLRGSGDPVPPSDYLDCSINYSLGKFIIYNPIKIDL